MSDSAILFPVFAQVLIAFILMFWMGNARIAAMKAKEVTGKDISLRKADLPEYAARVSNSYHNQFEMPVLFYALVALLIVTKQVDFTFVVLAWAYVIGRYLHMFIHILVESFVVRFYMFTLTAFILMGAWGLFAYQTIMAGI